MSQTHTAAEPDSDLPELLAKLAELESGLQDHLYDQHADSRDVARIKQIMGGRAKIITGLSDEIDAFRAALHTDEGSD